MTNNRPLAGRTLRLNFGANRDRPSAPLPQALLMSALIGSAADR